MSHIIGYTGRVSDEDLAGRDDPLLQLATIRFGKKGVERSLEDDLRGRAGAVQVEVNSVGRVVRELDRTEGQPGSNALLTIGPRSAALRRRAAEGASVGLGGGDGCRHRRRHRHGIDAGLRSQHVRPRHHAERVARPARQPRAAAQQQVDRRRLSAGLDLQGGDGAGGARVQGDRSVDRAALSRLPDAGRHQVPLLAEGRPWRSRRRSGARPVVRLLLLRGGQARPASTASPRRRPSWASARSATSDCRRIGRHPAVAPVEAGKVQQALATGRHVQPRHRPGLHELHAAAARHHDGPCRQRRLRGAAQPPAGQGHAARGAGTAAVA